MMKVGVNMKILRILERMAQLIMVVAEKF